MKKISFMLLLMLLLVSCSPQAEAEIRLTIIHINDVHGRTAAEPHISEMARGLTNVLIFDAGDRLHGQIATNLTGGQSMVEIMNTVGYSAMVTGNHDFNFGVERLLELSELMAFPLLAANVRDSGGSYLFERYKIFAMEGLTVGVFGIVTPETVEKSDPRIVAGLTFEDPAQTAAAMAEHLRLGGCDIIIALTHLGDDSIAGVPGIDVIIDGHSHELLEGTQAGEHSKHIGIIEIAIANGVMTTAARLVAVDELDGGDGAVMAVIAAAEAMVEDVTSAVVGYTPVALNGEREAVRTGETNLANLITDSMLYATGADIAFLTGGNIRASIGAGDITMGNVLTVLPFSNLLVTVELKGSDILEILEHGVSAYPEQAGSHIQTAGLHFIFEPTAPPMSRVVEANLIPDNIYTVATIEFIAAGGDGYTMMERGVNMIWYQGDAEAFIRYLQTSPAITAEPEGRVAAAGRIAA